MKCKWLLRKEKGGLRRKSLAQGRRSFPYLYVFKRRSRDFGAHGIWEKWAPEKRANRRAARLVFLNVTLDFVPGVTTCRLVHC